MTATKITQGSYDGEHTAGWVRVVRTRHQPDSVLRRHAHGGACFTLVLAGEFAEVCDLGRYRCGAGSLLFRPAFQPHANRYGPRGAVSVLIEIDVEGCDAPRVPQGDRTIRSAEARRRAWYVARAAAGGWLERDITEAARELVALADAEEHSEGLGSPPSPWLRRVYNRLAAQPCEPHPIASIAHDAGVHPDHLIRAFRTTYGATPWVFARRARARVAARLTTADDRSLSDIALACGYADQSHMTREFRRFLGTTPGRIRTSHRRDEVVRVDSDDPSERAAGA